MPGEHRPSLRQNQQPRFTKREISNKAQTAISTDLVIRIPNQFWPSVSKQQKAKRDHPQLMDSPDEESERQTIL